MRMENLKSSTQNGNVLSVIRVHIKSSKILLFTPKITI